MRAAVVLVAVTACRMGDNRIASDACTEGGACTPAPVCFAGALACGTGCARTVPRTGTCPGGTCETGVCIGDASTPLSNPDVADGYFGSAIDTDGTRIVVGAIHANAAYVLENVGGWKITATLTSAWGPANSNFGGAVAIQGNHIVVGARYSRGPSMTAGPGGAIVIYERDAMTNVWNEVAQVLGPDQGDFGGAVDLDGGRILVGAEQANAAYIVEESGSSWSVVAPLTDAGSDRLGHYVQMRGNRAYVGSLFDPGPNSAQTGAIRVFDLDGPTWELFTKIQPDEPRTNAFGQGFSVDGDTIAVGVPWYADGDRATGAIYFYTFNGSTWTTSGPLLPAVKLRDASFGRGVWLAGNRMVTTSIAGDDVIVHVYRRDLDGVWLEVARRIDANAASGTGLSIDGIEVDLQMAGLRDTALVGFPVRGSSGGAAPGAVLLQDLDGL